MSDFTYDFDPHLGKMHPRPHPSPISGTALWLRQDRQWTRTLRIAHARWQLSRAENVTDKKFWAEVLRKNGAD